MSVTSLSRWSGGNRDLVIANMNKAKPIVEKEGAEAIRVGQYVQLTRPIAVAAAVPPAAYDGLGGSSLSLAALPLASAHHEARSAFTEGHRRQYRRS